MLIVEMACCRQACGPDESIAIFDVMTRTDEYTASSLDRTHLLCVCVRASLHFWKVIVNSCIKYLLTYTLITHNSVILYSIVSY